MKTGIDTELHKRYWISKYSKVKIPLPPLDQQKKIAAILDAADAYRQKTKALITKYDELTQSLFLDMFGDPVTNPKGWRKHKLGDICHMKAGKFVKASDIISENNSNMYSCFGGNGLRGYVKSFTHEGEFLLIGRQGALCGNVKKVEGKFHATEHAIVCSPTMEYETLWLYHMLVMINLNKYATGAAQPGLNVGTLVELEAMFAPYALQNQFAERIQAIEAQKAQAQASLTQAEDLFNSLLQRAFKGELK
jgi:type I restriction enzyme, S subunit